MTETSPDIDAVIASMKRVPLDLARRLTGITTTAGRRAYLEETGSQYAAEDTGIMEAAFGGHVLNALASLADAYEREITPKAAPLPVPPLSASITTEQVSQLRDEAVAAGDMAQVVICDAALGGDGTAWAICEQVIEDAIQMAAGDEYLA